MNLAKKHSNIAGMKDTVSGMDHTRELIKIVKSQSPNLKYFSVSMTILPLTSSLEVMAVSAL